MKGLAIVLFFICHLKTQSTLILCAHLTAAPVIQQFINPTYKLKKGMRSLSNGQKRYENSVISSGFSPRLAPVCRLRGALFWYEMSPHR